MFKLSDCSGFCPVQLQNKNMSMHRDAQTDVLVRTGTVFGGDKQTDFIFLSIQCDCLSCSVEIIHVRIALECPVQTFSIHHRCVPVKTAETKFQVKLFLTAEGEKEEYSNNITLSQSLQVLSLVFQG